ncbi:hypothetical protein C0Q70_03803 [Pomacea canaliculata]|uniref:Uncharacterized protein n=1 Tax=Pomacea canaliculata TaxID=400727 RepID=A0A2T7PTQ4_POMCA|nr:hypothetical protein C0Q70_03803 [Pomacea canaliculata]
MRRLLILVAMVLLISGSCMSAPQPLGGRRGLMPLPNPPVLRQGMLAAPPPKVLGDVRKNPGKPLSDITMKRG